MAENRPIPPEIKVQMMRVLREYVNIGVIGRACEQAGVPRRTHFSWMKEYPIYAKRYNEVHEKFVDGLEEVAIARARDKSDSLLTLMLKAHRREVYGDRSEVTHKGAEGQIQLVFAAGMLTEDEKKLLGGQDNGSQEE